MGQVTLKTAIADPDNLIEEIGVKAGSDLTIANDADKTLNLENGAWDDSMVPPTVFRTGGTSLTLAELTDGIYAHRFDVGDTIHFDVQFPHRMKINTIISPHVHLVNKTAITGAALPSFTFKYTWANINSAFPATDSDTIEPVFTDAAALSHKLAAFEDITPAEGQGNISSILIGTLTRNNLGYTDGNIFLLGFDIHFQADTFGSRQEFVK
jgi:hypothetical protein